MSKKKHVPIVDLVDVSNWVHRAYHGVAPLSAKDGTPTNAIKGFSDMLSNLLEANLKANKGKACYVACCLDIKTEETFRYKIQHSWLKKNKKQAKACGLIADGKSPEYKGNRLPTDPEKLKESLHKKEELHIQMKIITKMLELSGIPTFKKIPWEADDLIGTLSQQKGCLSRIQSRDKDFAQLIDDGNVILIMPKQANAERMEIDSAKCFEHYGVHPKQIIHYLQLMGDKVDNIPGIPGVGPKTAINILAEHKTLRGIQKNLDSIKGKSKWIQMLRDEIAGRPPFSLTFKLVRIATNIPDLPTDYRDLQIKKPSKELFKFKRSLQLKSIFGY